MKRYKTVSFFLSLSIIVCARGSDYDGHPNWLLLDKDCGISMSDRIIGGKTASLGQFPWIARLGYSGFGVKFFFCGGSLINPDYVVTAAHCVSDPKYKLNLVRFGDWDVRTNPDCDGTMGFCAPPVQDRTIARIIVNKRYHHKTFLADISLLRLNRPVEYNGFVYPICLPHSEVLKTDNIGSKMQVAGWGLINTKTKKLPKILQYVSLPVVPLRICDRIYRYFTRVNESYICVGGELNYDSCVGDSGGPLMEVRPGIYGTPRYNLMGLVSFGAEECGSEGVPGVYTNVPMFMEWILDNIEP